MDFSEKIMSKCELIAMNNEFEIAEIIKSLRIAKGLTQEDMSEGEDGIPYRTIQNLESGKSSPSLKTLYKLAKKLDVPVSKILGE